MNIEPGKQCEGCKHVEIVPLLGLYCNHTLNNIEEHGASYAPSCRRANPNNNCEYFEEVTSDSN